jgi:pumilio RNA-binding family
MQELIPKMTQNSLNVIIEHISERLSDLMMDPYGNWFCQKLFEVISSQQRLRIVQTLSPNVLKISQDPVGTLTMQRLISRAKLDEEQIIFFNSIKPYIVEMSFDEKANYVLLLILENSSVKRFNFIAELLKSSFLELCKKQYGVCIVNVIIKKTKQSEMKAHILNLLSSKIHELITHQYGNYAITTIIEVCNSNYLIKYL